MRTFCTVTVRWHKAQNYEGRHIGLSCDCRCKEITGAPPGWSNAFSFFISCVFLVLAGFAKGCAMNLITQTICLRWRDVIVTCFGYVYLRMWHLLDETAALCYWGQGRTDSLDDKTCMLDCSTLSALLLHIFSSLREYELTCTKECKIGVELDSYKCDSCHLSYEGRYESNAHNFFKKV